MKANEGEFLRSVHTAASTDPRRSLVERIATSRHFNKSARLRDLLTYLAKRVLDGDAEEIHEQEVGCKVFGRPVNYDTSSDNIVRVHASLLRKRLDRYFASDGAGEPLLLEIRKGNYAPVFHPRPEIEFVPAADPSAELGPPPRRASDWRLNGLALVACALSVSTAWLWFGSRGAPRASAGSPNVMAFWAAIVRPDRVTDIVMDDAAVGIYQELTGRLVSLQDYFDRGYLRALPGGPASEVVLRRQSSFAAVNLLWKLIAIPGIDRSRANLRFARDYSFRDLKADNAILLGNSHTNPWIESFEPKVGLRWTFDSAAGIYYPVDSWPGGKTYRPDSSGEAHEGFCAIALLPNLGGANVLTISGTGGSAINAGIEFLSDERSVGDLRKRLNRGTQSAFPYFELLLRVKGRTASVADARAEIVRAPK